MASGSSSGSWRAENGTSDLSCESTDNETPEGTLGPPSDPHHPEQALESTCRCEHRLVRYRWFTGPFGQDEDYGPGARPRYGLIHEFREFQADPALPSTDDPRAVRRWDSARRRKVVPSDRPDRRLGRPSVMSVGRARPTCGPATALPSDRFRRANEMPRGTSASFPTHLPPCKHESRLADASTGGISRFSNAPLGKT